MKVIRETRARSVMDYVLFIEGRVFDIFSPCICVLDVCSSERDACDNFRYGGEKKRSER